jgi:tRNA (guanine-N7-)-methyltransferase
VGKNKLARWNELTSFENVVQPEIGEISAKDHPVKGCWCKNIFKNNNRIILELGCGKGEYTIGLATRFPGNNYIGVDIKGARMWRGAKTANTNKLPNVAFLRTRIEFINSFFTADEVSEIWITFPDPHPGGRNSNKRLTSPWFLNKYRNFLQNKGLVHLKTDNDELYQFTKKVASFNSLETIFVTNDLHSGSSDSKSSVSELISSTSIEPTNLKVHSEIYKDILSIRTHYESLFLKKGEKINYICFELDKEKIIENP